jgi:hypothetical protein
MPSAKILSEVNRNLLAVPASVGISRDLIAGFAMTEGLVRYAERHGDH